MSNPANMTHMIVREAVEKLGECAVDSLIIGRTIDDALEKVSWCQAHGQPGVKYGDSRCLCRVLWPCGFTTTVMAAEDVRGWVVGMNFGVVWLSNLAPEMVEGWSNVELALRLDPMLVITTGWTDAVIQSERSESAPAKSQRVR